MILTVSDDFILIALRLSFNWAGDIGCDKQCDNNFNRKGNEKLSDAAAGGDGHLQPEDVRVPLGRTYENHLRKLTQIRQERKTQLQLDHSRNLQMQQIKNSKSKTFANKFNDKNLEINQSNVKFLVKL